VDGIVVVSPVIFPNFERLAEFRECQESKSASLNYKKTEKNEKMRMQYKTMQYNYFFFFLVVLIRDFVVTNLDFLRNLLLLGRRRVALGDAIGICIFGG
jgi:hypothetical protein